VTPGATSQPGPGALPGCSDTCAVVGAAIELGRVFEEAAAAHPGKSGVNYIRRDLPSGAERPGAREVDLGIDGGVGGGDGGSRRVLE
jgi:hypothetical protein